MVEIVLLAWFALVALGVTAIVVVCCRSAGEREDGRREPDARDGTDGLSSPSR